MARTCQVAGCTRDAVMAWNFINNPMSPAGVDVCVGHVREALLGGGRLHRAILATLDVVCPPDSYLPDETARASAQQGEKEG